MSSPAPPSRARFAIANQNAHQRRVSHWTSGLPSGFFVVGLKPDKHYWIGPANPDPAIFAFISLNFSVIAMLYTSFSFFFF